tara:strand:- start:1617 stop:2522 length:906 start_codon:yes stop_codon:yes gene_type:complete
MGTLSEVQHREKVRFYIWTDNRLTYDYYLFDEKFTNCFTSVETIFRDVNVDYFSKFNPSEYNLIVLPVWDIDSYYHLIYNMSDNLRSFAVSKNIPIVLAAGDLNILEGKEFNKLKTCGIPSKSLKILVNESEIKNDYIVSINAFPAKLYNFFGWKLHYDYFEAFNVLQPLDKDYYVSKDDTLSQWFETWQIRSSAISVLDKKVEYWKALMLGAPFIWNSDKKLKTYFESFGFKMYPWIDYSFDGNPKKVKKELKRLLNIDNIRLFVKKNSYYINLHNKRLFHKIALKDDNYSFFAKQVFTF